MIDPSVSQSMIFVELLFVFLALIVACVLYFLLRLIVTKLFVRGGKFLAVYLARLSLPAVFLVVILCLKLPALSDRFFSSGAIEPYLDAAVIFFAVFFVIRLLDAFVQSWFVRIKKPFPLPKVLQGLVLAIIYLIVFFIVLRGILGVNITPFLATSALLTMIIGLAFQGVLSNILSGMSLHLIKSFGKGDWISVGTDEGVVMDTNWRETRIFDRFSNIVVIPNNTVASEAITNYSAPDRKTALTIPVKASYEAPPTEVFEALREAAADVPEVLAHPMPEVHLLSYDDFGISYVIKFWVTDFARKYPIMAEVGRKIWYKFRRRGIEIPVPLSDKLGEVMFSMDAEKKSKEIETGVSQNFSDLMRSDFLKYKEGERAGAFLISEDDMREFAGMVKRYRYAPGEVVFKQGDGGESCFVVASGKISGKISYHEKGKEYTSAFEIQPGGLFGEMSLFTGMPRTATGIVVDEAELLEIGAKDFAYLLDKNPRLSEALAEIVSKRNQENQALLEKLKELSKKDIEHSTNKRSILARLSSLIRH
jgi:small-conductance mechanosensitive channel/CRP-like cAMP-binding protein